ncbi:hypothetical protein [Methanohalobium evestigatum]|uniref:hypothetical protein n=1 Tax=Methanohalobium evestigatum TaxID=2322 RepID=UPI000677994B|nr:hypothetical protein [Methanohalobium evestigatum]
MKKKNIYLKFIDETLKIIRRNRLPLYSSKYSKQDYNQHQLMVMVLFKDYIVTDYKRFTQLLELMYPVIDKLELEKSSFFTITKNYYLGYLLQIRMDTPTK